MGVSDGINVLTEDGENIHVYGEFPEVEELKFPAIIIEHSGSGFEEQFMGQQVLVRLMVLVILYILYVRRRQLYR